MTDLFKCQCGDVPIMSQLIHGAVVDAVVNQDMLGVFFPFKGFPQGTVIDHSFSLQYFFAVVGHAQV
jgi:hypothetical protein